MSLRFDRPFFKEFTLRVAGDVPGAAAGLPEEGYHAGLPLGRWYPDLADCFSVAVTEKRTKAEIDGLAKASGMNAVAPALSSAGPGPPIL